MIDEEGLESFPNYLKEKGIKGILNAPVDSNNVEDNGPILQSSDLKWRAIQIVEGSLEYSKSNFTHNHTSLGSSA